MTSGSIRRGSAFITGALAWILCQAAWAPSVAWAESFDLQLTTSRGCRETGDDPVYAVGDTITVNFRAGSSVVSAASLTLFDVLPDGRVGVDSFGTLPTNQTRAFVALVGPPTGIEQLVLRAEAPGVDRTQRSCSFRVVPKAPAGTATATPPVTRTPTPVRATRTPTRTGGPQFSAELRTDRGCIETGENPIFLIGDPIVVSFRIDSTSSTIARAVLADFLANGFVRVFTFGLLPTNARLQFHARIGPPVGIERLVLNARGVGGVAGNAVCSFKVVSRFGRTPGATRTATHVPPTRTPTATPGSGTAFCTGDCSQTGTVTLDDLATVVDIAAGKRSLDECPWADTNGDGQVSLSEVLHAARNADDGCDG